MTISVTEVKKLLSNIGPNVTIWLKTPQGEFKVQTRADIIENRYPDLIGQEITVTDAAKKYGVDRRNILRWKDKGYVSVIKSGYGMTLNEAEIAYCADTYKDQRSNGYAHGTPLFDASGLPYQLKHPDLSQRRKKS